MSNGVTLVPLGALDRHALMSVSVVGVVVEFSVPRKSRGTDMFTSLKIVDDSNKVVSVNMFIPCGVPCPVIRDAGDIILLRGAIVDMYDGELYLRIRLSCRRSQYWIYSGTNVGRFEPYLPHRAPAAPNTANAAIDRLRQCPRSARLKTGLNVYEVVSIKDLMHNTYPDLVCKVLHIHPGDGHIFLYVWDGTDAPSQRITPVYGERYTSRTFLLNTDFDQLADSVIESFPPAGTILRIVVDVDNEDLAQYFYFEHKWVKVWNICYKSVDGLWKASSDNLKIRFLEHLDPSVEEIYRNYNNRVHEKDCVPMSYDPLASQLTEIIPPDIECNFSTLLHVRVAPVGMMFKCIIRVLAFNDSEDSINFRITIEDPTTRIHASTPPMDGIHLFSDVQSQEEFLGKFKKLIGYPENGKVVDSLSPPWIPCIIKTAVDLDGNRTYHLIRTKFARRNDMNSY